ncbi:MAG TPA: 16S rRNA (adenine(1518)-N(6)/adenine(1519)-N(6))-dimethyltransferase RsmA [Tepidisphaeraceae bacterium]|jgi:16S rRNA (adenine1518-N6/adenine1519-N6)-dimethyltransferase|nr:16S rRNA (adenine(1518)-N(6)/adenine(1519)-N(6))-dimethyltransferase RsmA [Tepidisphaeraceae bacterium]
MAQTKHQIQSLLAEASARPLHRFGQNFMIDQNLVRLVAAAGEPTAGDVLIEVGPGTGTLTEELLASGASVVAVEIDRGLADLNRRQFAQSPNFSLIEGDALAGKHALNSQLLSTIGASTSAGRPVKLIANLPYNIASPLVIESLIAGVDLLAFTVQKEVADRLRASPANSQDYGPLSVMSQLLAEVEVLRTLPPQAFWPMPKIASALVRLRRRDQLGASAGAFGRFVHGVFSFRRKTLRNSLGEMGVDADAILAAAGLDGRLRPEAFSPGELLRLFHAD